MATLSKWTAELEIVCEKASGGQLAWLFTPFRVCHIPYDDTKFATLLKMIANDDLNGISDAQFKEAVARATNCLPLKLGELARMYFHLIRLAVKTECQQVLSVGLGIIDFWIKAIYDEELDGWTSAGLASVISFCVDTATLSDSLEPSDDQDSTDDAYSLQRILNGIRKHIGKFRENDVRLIGVYTILLSESIRLCLKLSNPPMATAFLQTIPTNQPMSVKAQRGPATRFKYYYANLMLQREQYNEAVEPLEFAAYYCPQRCVDLRVGIYAALLTVKMRLGFVPPANVMLDPAFIHGSNITATSTNPLQVYWPIVVALRTGHLRLFNETLEQHNNQFYEHGTIILLNQVKFIVQQRLLSIIYDWYGKNVIGVQQNVLPLSLINTGLKTSLGDPALDVQETMCIVANLIQLGYVKGYIAWQHRKIVLSKINPFPIKNT